MKLIKILTAFIALASLQIAAAQWLNVPPPAEAKNLMVFTARVPVAGLSCNTTTPVFQQTTRDAYNNLISSEWYSSQKIKNSASITICQASILISTDAATAKNVTVSVWSTTDESGTKYGDGAVTSIPAVASYVWYDFVFSGTKPNPTGDFFLHVDDTDHDGNHYWGKNTNVNSYEDTNYDSWRDGSDMGNDGCFKINTMQ